MGVDRLIVLSRELRVAEKTTYKDFVSLFRYCKIPRLPNQLKTQSRK